MSAEEPGVYARRLVARGYRVHLIDVVPDHVVQADEDSARNGFAYSAAHELGAAAYAIKAVRAAAPEDEAESAGRAECRWQREQLPDGIRDLVLDDRSLRNDICWSVFDFS